MESVDLNAENISNPSSQTIESIDLERTIKSKGAQIVNESDVTVQSVDLSHNNSKVSKSISNDIMEQARSMLSTEQLKLIEKKSSQLAEIFEKKNSVN